MGNILDQPDEAIGIRKGQRPKKDCVDDTVDGGGRSDSNPEAEQRRDRKCRRPAELSHRVAHIARKILE